MTTFHLGTMGYGYKDWLGAFYPDKTKPDTYLSLYSRVFDSVEMDTTFYAIPRAEIVERWREQTPDGFIFCPKTPRAITHENDLENGLPLMEDFVHAVSILEEKLGPILIQFPPDFDFSNAGKLNRFLGRLPVASGLAPLRRRIPPPLVGHARNRQTALRSQRLLDFHGIPTLEKWKEWLDTETQRENPPTAVYAYFNDDFSGHAPATVNDFRALHGLPVTEPEIPTQRPLF